jgi:hypothetical protein
MRTDALPYLVPDPTTVEMTSWVWSSPSGWEPVPSTLPGWDPAMRLELRRSVRVDRDRLSAETRLDLDCPLQLTVSWTSSTSGMRGSAVPVLLSADGVAQLDVTLPGDRIGGVLDIRTSLTLAVSVPGEPGIATMAGSVLSEDRSELVLEEDLRRFPVHEIEFASTRLDPDASWFLETTTELTAPFLGSFLLMLNRRDTELSAAVLRGAKDARQEALVDELEHGVAALMLELAAQLSDELAERRKWPSGSVGEVLSETLSAAERSGTVQAATGPHDLARARARLDGAVRVAGHGRRFR